MGPNSELLEAVEQIVQASLNPQVIQSGGAGKAYQAVAQSAALAIQDAVDALRVTTATATTASGIALAQFLASGDARYLDVLSHAQAMVTKAIEDLGSVGDAATAVLAEFPSR